MKRRDFIAFLGVAAARAQAPRRVIGTLSGFEPAILGGSHKRTHAPQQILAPFRLRLCLRQAIVI
jgi:hypothetical protein